MHAIRQRAGLAIQVLSLLSLVLLMQGCQSKSPPSSGRFPIASGSHTSLPLPQQRILLWGDPPLTDVAMEWLRSHHYSNVVMPENGPINNAPQIAHSSSDHKVALVVAREMQADFVLFLEREESKNGALLESQCGSLFSVDVRVSGLSVENGEVALRGNAHYPHCVELSVETIRNLTCQAFATAWGYRPSGQLDIPSSLMCTVGQTKPIPVR